jgi:hypothetical protein
VWHIAKVDLFWKVLLWGNTVHVVNIRHIFYIKRLITLDVSIENNRVIAIYWRDQLLVSKGAGILKSNRQKIRQSTLHIKLKSLPSLSFSLCKPLMKSTTFQPQLHISCCSEDKQARILFSQSTRSTHLVHVGNESLSFSFVIIHGTSIISEICSVAQRKFLRLCGLCFKLFILCAFLVSGKEIYTSHHHRQPRQLDNPQCVYLPDII